MNKRRILVIVIMIGCVMITIAGVAYARFSENPYFLAGRYLKEAESREKQGIGEMDIVASYHGHNITTADIEYARNLNVLRDAVTASKYETDADVVNRILEDIILKEEAQKRGIAATEKEINDMVNGAVKAYATPEGKSALDAYLKGAEITFEEYLTILREKAPAIIAKQKLKNEIGKQYCEENGLEYRNGNPPAGMLEAQDKYIGELLEKNKGDVVYY